MSGERQPIVREYQGQVKWFDNRLGYGFITINSNGENSGKDIFVHQTNITPTSSEYRTLSKGEYVSFNLSNDEKCQGLDVSGINGGPLRCDAPRPLHHRRRQEPGQGSGQGHRNRNSDQSTNTRRNEGETSDRHDRR
jgi:cold shock CspA family protein